MGGDRRRPPAGGLTASPLGDRRRSMCIWLGYLSSWRQGLIGRLVRDYGSVAAVLERPCEELAVRVTTEPRRRGRGQDPGLEARGSNGPRRQEAEAASDAARLREGILDGPERCSALMLDRPSGQCVLAWCDPLYPAALRQLADPPLCLFVRGGSSLAEASSRLQALASGTTVAIVGSRAPSPYGLEMAALLGRDLVRRGAHVVSGLALGIDAAAQTAAVAEAGLCNALTVAVLGSGADVPYPRTNADLYREIARDGLVVSEFAWGVPARSWRFPARNRVMAALSRAVVIVEGTERSGARITADYAADLGREVLAVPGEAGRRLSAAPHSLLRYGAGLCEGAADVLRAIAFDPSATVDAGSRPDEGGVEEWLESVVSDLGEGPHRDVLRALQESSLSIDGISERCHLAAHRVAAALGILEVEGLVHRSDGGIYRLAER